MRRINTISDEHSKNFYVSMLKSSNSCTKGIEEQFFCGISDFFISLLFVQKTYIYLKIFVKSIKLLLFCQKSGTKNTINSLHSTMNTRAFHIFGAKINSLHFCLYYSTRPSGCLRGKFENCTSSLDFSSLGG